MNDPAERAPRSVPPAAAEPRRSVVIVSTGDRAFLERSLASAVARFAAQSLDLVVVRNGTAAEVATLGRLFRGVRFVAAPGGTADELRAAGLHAASGDVVTLVHDSSLPELSERALPVPIITLADAPSQPTPATASHARVISSDVQQ